MKKIIVFVLVMIISTISFSQQISTPVPVLTKSDYLQKSKKQFTVGLVTGIAGSALFAFGLQMYLPEAIEIDYDQKKIRTGSALMIAGGSLIIIAIPIQLASRKNKKMAMSIGLKRETILTVQKNFAATSIPSLDLKISL